MNENTQVFLAYLEYKAIRQSANITPVISFLRYRGIVLHYVRCIHRSLFS